MVIKMDGIIVVNKSAGMTSHDVVNKVRRILKTKKVGHAGTLDPIATGVLPILIGKATKLSNEVMSEKKEYIAKIKLGIKTDTGDITGNVIESDTEKKIKEIITDKEKIINTIDSFIGVQVQTPPIYSSIKINGKKLYEYAREGKKVEIPTRQIEIYNIELLNVNENDGTIDIRVECSKGTYIRSLCEDIASKLGTVGTMLKLKRTRTGIFDIEGSYTLEEIEEKGENIQYISIEELYKDAKDIQLTKEELEKFLNGMQIKTNENNSNDVSVCKVYAMNVFIGLRRNKRR